MTKGILIFLFFIHASSLINGQSIEKKCISHENYLEKIKTNPEIIQNRLKLENYTANLKSKKTAKIAQDSIFRIPIVIHVIHSGEAIGTGQNISDEQIYSQLDVLNQDFRLLNIDQLDISHPFYNNIADCGIEFCIADIDQSGTSTSGINRYNFQREDWTYANVEDVIKPLTAWDRTKYLNIWLVKLGGADKGTLGYATFPETNDETDGVVIVPKYFGTTGIAEYPFNLGRTATHEIGHYFNLIHIWGDETCGDDNVDDTAPQEESTSGCPSFPNKTFNSCGTLENGEMFMNYMDYSYDNCLNMFTIGQKERMRAAIEGSRASLLSSAACSANNGVQSVSAIKTSIYPNPANNIVNVILNSQINIKNVLIFNSLGQMVNNLVNKEINGQNILINTENLNSGNYFVKIESEKEVVYQKFVILK